jgi:hypothetical protein
MDPVTFTFPGFRNICSGKIFTKEAPLSTDYVIVFPVNADKKFSRTIYSSAMTQGRASSDDVHHALNLFEIIFSRLSISTADLWRSLLWRFILPFIAIFMCEINYMLRHSEPIWFFFWVYCIAGVCYLLYNRNQEIKRAKTDIESIVQTVQPGYLKRGLRWRIPEDSCGWIELIKEYREGEKASDVAVQVHPSGIEKSNEMKSHYEPPQNASQEMKPTTTTTTSYPPIHTGGLSSQ